LLSIKVTWRIEDDWLENHKLWQFSLTFRQTSESLDPGPDSQSTFDYFYLPGASLTNERTGLHTFRRGGIQPWYRYCSPRISIRNKKPI